MAKRTRITRPYPTHSIQDTLPIAETIQRVNGGRPVQTEHLADALSTSARSSTFIQKLNASSKYGLTVGSYSDEFIRLTDLGESITAPGSAEEKNDSIVEAITKPEIFGKFYRMYSGKRMPEDIYASNTLVRELGVPRELTEECLGIIRRNGLVAGIVSDRRGALMVDAVADSEAGGYYAAENSKRRGATKPDSEEGESDGVESRSGLSAEILIVSEPDDPALGEITGLVDALSAPRRSAHLDMSSSRIIPDALADALESARGCIFVWPSDEDVGGGQRSDARIWAALGAASYKLRERLVVAVRDGDGTSTNPALSDPTITVVGVKPGESVYPHLVASLVRSGIVRISVG